MVPAEQEVDLFLAEPLAQREAQNYVPKNHVELLALGGDGLQTTVRK
jgi:hypothetical protein